MKKILALLLALVMCLSLAACGGGSEMQSTKPPEEHSDTTEATQSNNAAGSETMLDTPIVLYDDDTVRIEIISLFEQVFPWATGEALEKGFVMKIQNKTDHDVSVEIIDAYIGADAAMVIQGDGNTQAMAGKNAQISYIVQKHMGSQMVALDSLDELFNLNGQMTIVNRYDDSSKNHSYHVSFEITDSN